jgi:Ca2+-binding EF-hand superfamily protein
MSSVSSTSNYPYLYTAQRKARDKLDTEQNGSLEERQYQTSQPKTQSKNTSSELYEALDGDGSGPVGTNAYLTGPQAASSSGLLSQLSSSALDVLMQLQPQDGASTGLDANAKAMFGALDSNQDGSVSEDEFAAGHPGTLSSDQAKKLFEVADADKDGKLAEGDMTFILDATTPPRLMGESYFGAQSDAYDAASGSLSALLGSSDDSSNSAQHLFDLLGSEPLNGKSTL